MSRESISPKLRFDVLKRDGFTCQYCGRSAPEVELHVDHVVPVAEGGGNDPGNLTAACVDCNLGKSDSLLADAVHALRKAKSEEEWVERMAIFVRSRFAGARPVPARHAIQEALCWGLASERLVTLTDDATSWLDWLRRIYTAVGMLMERDQVASASKDRWDRWDEMARKAVAQACTPVASPETSEAAPTTSEVN
jgi:hypothetical protein